MRDDSSPIRAGITASIHSRTRRARTGEAPPVPIATTTSPRSTTAGNTKVERSGRSTTFTGTLRARASAATPSSSGTPVADTTETNSEKSACNGSAKDSSSRPVGGLASSTSSATSALEEYQRTLAPDARSSRSLVSAAGPEPTSATVPLARSRKTGKKRIGRSVSQNDFLYKKRNGHSNGIIFHSVDKLGQSIPALWRTKRREFFSADRQR